MLRHYLLMAGRGLARHKLYSFINVAGLSVPLACAILILLFVRDQLSYDAWIPGTQNLYRLAVTFHLPGSPPLPTTGCPFPVLTAVGEKIPQVKAVVHVVPEKMTVIAGDRQGYETVTVVDPNFFQVLRIPLLRGDPAQVLRQPESIVISENMAHRYFGDVDPLGKTLRVSGKLIDYCAPHGTSCYGYGVTHPLTVTGVMRDLPHETQLIANFVVPNDSQADEVTQVEKHGFWGPTLGGYGYVELAPKASPSAVLAALDPILDGSVDYKDLGIHVRGSQVQRYRLIPFRDVHLDSDKYGGMTPGGNRATVYGLGVIALLIVLVACSNFMNLATARATLREREIAVRKVAGAKRAQIALQILIEALVTAFVSFGVALSFAEILLPGYQRFLGEPMRLHYLADWRLLLAMGGGAVVVGLLSGIYPALVLSGFRPASALKGGSGRTGSGLLRSALVVSQFAVSIAVAIAATVVFRQISYARSVDLGFNRDDVVVLRDLINLPPDARESLARILRSGPGIDATALSDTVPLDLWSSFYLRIRSAKVPQGTSVRFMRAGPSFAPLYRIRLLAGRVPSESQDREKPGPSTAALDVLLNATAAHRLGYSPDQAVGQTFSSVWGRLRVIGVLADVAMGGVGERPEPSVYLPDSGQATLLSVRVRASELPRALPFIQRVWRSLAPSVAMDSYFLTDAFNEQFAADERQGTIFAVFVAVAVLIGCLGLFGLAVFTAERRTKEIGIRKVSGARTGDIMRLMLWRISVPVLAANLVAWPLAYYYLHQWLERYAYRISLSPTYFLAAGAVALTIAWATVYGSTLRLARISPVHALRHE